MFERTGEAGFGVCAPGGRCTNGGPGRFVRAGIIRESRQCIAPMVSAADATPHVFVLDRDAATRRSIEVMLRGSGNRVEGFSSASAFLARSCVAAPSCLILEVAPGHESLSLQKRLAIERPDMPIIVVAGIASVPTCVEAMKTGALDFFLKPFEENPFVESVVSAIGRSRAVLRGAANLADLRCRYASLTCREVEVMDVVVSGLLNKQIADRLGISEITVKAHRGRVMRKMRASSLANLVTIALKLGLTRAEPSRLPVDQFVGRRVA